MTHATIQHIDDAPRELHALGEDAVIMWTLIRVNDHIFLRRVERRPSLNRAIEDLARRELIATRETALGGIAIDLTERGRIAWTAPDRDARDRADREG